MDHIVRPIGVDVQERDLPDGSPSFTFVFADPGGDRVMVGPFGLTQWDNLQAMMADPAGARAAAEARAQIVTPPGAKT